MTDEFITFDREKLKKFREAYDKAKLHPLTDVFEFEGNQFVLGYAKYMIEYLEKKFGPENRNDEDRVRIQHQGSN